MPERPDMVPATAVVDQLKSAGLGYERVDLIPGSTYKDNSTVIVIPTRGKIAVPVVQSLLGLMAPMNGKRAMLFASGDEVGVAYNNMISNILANPELRTWKYIMTIEDDNIVPPDAHLKLLESIEELKLDAVSGIYFTKGEINLPMAYGDPDEYARTGVLDFRPRDIREAVKAGQVMRVNGIACGCALWRMELFKELLPPWYVTVSEVVPGKGPQAMTQDLYFCLRAIKEKAKRFAVDMRVRVGHLDVATGILY